jgi:hypothetical protein
MTHAIVNTMPAHFSITKDISDDRASRAAETSRA